MLDLEGITVDIKEDKNSPEPHEQWSELEVNWNCIENGLEFGF